MTQAPSSATRKDAARNRARLLESAEQLFATEGLDVTLKDVARHAGVGVGTVYRHFPTKDDLVNALFAENLDREVERARRMAQEPDAWQALVSYLEETMLVQASNCGLRALMCPAGSHNDTVRECKTVIDPYVEQIVSAAHQQGTLRSDCTARDIAFLQVALVGIMDASPESPDLYRRHLELFLDGVRTQESTTESAS
ncbi:TetR/AcrR family transcriptional regulator [Streptomyces sp. NPDC001037]|uniref:TetR/AcrR family transcriptional regulator n=1 Tax=Streptomyces sp. NPDC001037 TaxID=3364542 RepID=UPI00369BB78E